MDADYISNDVAAGGGYVRVRGRFNGFGGTTQRGHTFSVTSSTMCHEFGHVLGLTDLFDQSSISADGELDPEEDSAGIGKWGLMGLGTLGWGIEDGPNALSGPTLAELGWVEVDVVDKPEEGIELEEIFTGRRLLKIPLSRHEYFLLEYRRASGSYYNRNIPRDGLLLWHIDELADNDEERHKRVDLVCADGLYADRGAPRQGPICCRVATIWTSGLATRRMPMRTMETKETGAIHLTGFATTGLRGIQTLHCAAIRALRGVSTCLGRWKICVWTEIGCTLTLCRRRAPATL